MGGYRTNLEIKKFLLGRFLRVALPCEIWAIIVFIATVFSYPINTIISLLNMQGLGWIFLRRGLIDGGPYLSHTWFVTIILICYFMVPVLQRNKDKISILLTGGIYLTSIFLLFIGINITYFSLFVISYMAGVNSFDGKRISVWILMFALFGSIGLRIIGHQYFDGTVI